MEGVRAKVVGEVDQLGKVKLRSHEIKHIRTMDWAPLAFSNIQQDLLGTIYMQGTFLYLISFNSKITLYKLREVTWVAQVVSKLGFEPHAYFEHSAIN